MKRVLSKIFTALFTLSTVLLLLFFAILIPATSRGFYKWQFEKYGVVQKVQQQAYRLTGQARDYIKNANESDVLDLMNHVIRYCFFLESDLNPTVDGVYLEVFREDEISHMQDVKNVFGGGLIIVLVSFLIFVAGIVLYIIYRKGYYKNVRKVPYITLACFIAIILFIVGFAVIDFDTAFEIFHKILFDGNWQFANGVMVIMISYIFNDLVFVIAGMFFIGVILFVLAEKLLYKQYKKESFTALPIGILCGRCCL